MWQTLNVGILGGELRYLGQAARMVEGSLVYPGGVIGNPPLFSAVLAFFTAS